MTQPSSGPEFKSRRGHHFFSKMQKTEIKEKHGDAVIDIALDTIEREKQALVFVGTKRSAEKQAEEVRKRAEEEVKTSAEKIYAEALAKGEAEAEEILENAQHKADQIVDEALKEAEEKVGQEPSRLREAAREEADKIKADAKQQAQEIIDNARHEANLKAEETAAQIKQKAQAAADDLRERSNQQAQEIITYVSNAGIDQNYNEIFRSLDVEKQKALVENMIETKIKPTLEADSGGIELVNYIPGEVPQVWLNYLGACSGCHLGSTSTADMLLDQFEALIDKNVVLYLM